MDLEEKKNSYTALGVVSYVEHVIGEYESQREQKPNKIILGRLEWDILGCGEDDYLIHDVQISLNQNLESGIIAG